MLNISFLTNEFFLIYIDILIWHYRWPKLPLDVLRCPPVPYLELIRCKECQELFDGALVCDLNLSLGMFFQEALDCRPHYVEQVGHIHDEDAARGATILGLKGVQEGL